MVEVAGPMHGPVVPLAFAALGVVFGDIGTSPLYSLQTVFSINHGSVHPTRDDVFGVISMVFWSITLVVSVKYVALVMHADNDGEGGILALVALLREKLLDRAGLARTAILLGVVGAALFYGDSVITPAISVMSAIEGVAVVDPSFQQWVLPLSMIVLTALFGIQRFGTAVVGRAFGPVMAVWFIVIAVLGVPEIVKQPAIVAALSPHYALLFTAEHPFTAFIALGAVVLTITGAEALYADMGHFGAHPIRLAWFFLVFPCLTVNYLGQGAEIIEDPRSIVNPFFLLAPSWATIPLVVLATLATVIASQAVISGAYSVSRQAQRLGLLPRMTVVQTSKEEGGQIYVGSINWILFVGVVLLIGVFRSSARLATAYGLAVTGTLMLTTALFLMLVYYVWHWATWKVVLTGVVIGGVELTFFTANLTKLISGGWLPMLIASIVVTLMVSWRMGQKDVSVKRQQMEGTLDEFVREVHNRNIARVPGLAVFPHPNRVTTPLALRNNVEFNRVLHEHVVIVTIINENVPHIRHVDRVSVNDLGYMDDGIVHVSCRVGFNDSQDVPKALRLAYRMSDELGGNPDEAKYFVSTMDLQYTGKKNLASLRKRIFVWMSHNAAKSPQMLRLPLERTVVMGAHLELQ